MIILGDIEKHVRYFIHYFHCQEPYTGKMSQEIIERLEIVIEKTLSCWRNLLLSTNMVKIHVIEDHLLDQIKNTMELCF